LATIFTIVFATVGLVVSLIGGFLVGNRFSYIMTVSAASSLAFAGLGFGVYRILEKRVPEFLEFLESLAGIVRDGVGSSQSMQGDLEGMDSDYRTLEEGLGEGFAEVEGEVRASSKPSKISGDVIMVDNIAIKNEPKLMAEAIRTMMAKDNENT